MGWLFRKRQGPKALPFQVRKVLQSRFSMDPRVMDRLRFVEKSEDMAGKQVRYFRSFDPDLVALAHRCLDERGYGAYASPFIGHGIGLETVEAPLLQPGVEMTLQPGMVLCIEPSLRIPNWGGCCVEEEVLVTEDGYRPLTTFPARLW